MNKPQLGMLYLMMAGLVLAAFGCSPFEAQDWDDLDDADFDGDPENAQDEDDPDESDPDEGGPGEGGSDEGDLGEGHPDEGGTGEGGSDEGDLDEGGPDEGDPEGGDPGDDGEPLPADDAAEVVAVNLPTQLECGASYLASVEMRNTGQATWTRSAGYKLGVVDDDDDLYGPGTRVWLDEGVTVAPGSSHVFEFELTAPQLTDAYLTDWQMVHEGVQWFGESTSQTVVVSCSAQTWCDPLTDSSLHSGFDDKNVDGGSFSAAGWQSTGSNDQLLLRLATPLAASGSLEIDVTNFDPTTQYTGPKHQIINMYTSNDGSQGVFGTDEAWWNIRTGSNYGTGFKFLAAPNGGDSREEVRLVENAAWDPNETYTFTVTWDAHTVDIYLDGTQLQSLDFDGRVQPLEHIFIGKDNVFYTGQVGPIYSNLCLSNEP